MSEENRPKPQPKQQPKNEPKQGGIVRESGTAYIGESHAKQEEINKAYELTPKIKPPKKDK